MKAICKKCNFEVSGKDRAELDARFRPHFETYGHESYVIVKYD
jgi:predicted small metal-binding protein